MSVWIKCKDRLPETHKYVLLWCVSEGQAYIGYFYATYNSKAWFTVFDSQGTNDISDDYMNYWQELPKGPDELP